MFSPEMLPRKPYTVLTCIWCSHCPYTIQFLIQELQKLEAGWYFFKSSFWIMILCSINWCLSVWLLWCNLISSAVIVFVWKLISWVYYSNHSHWRPFTRIWKLTRNDICKKWSSWRSLWAIGALIFYDVFSLKVLIENSTYKDIFALSDQQY